MYGVISGVDRNGEGDDHDHDVGDGDYYIYINDGIDL